MTTLTAHGLHAELPERWEGRLYLRDAAEGHPGEVTNPVLHMGNFALPPGRGDFGTGAVETMRGEHAFVSLVEYGGEEAGRALFAARGFPALTLTDFAPNQLQRTLPGQLGTQKFFTDQGRAFCLYVVLGSQWHAAALLREVNEVVIRLRVGDRWARV